MHGRNAEQYTFDPSTDLSEEQRAWLDDEDNEDEVVGSCIYTGWHWDVTEAPRNPDVGSIHGVPVNFENFQMHGRFNNNGAARALVRDGLAGVGQQMKRLRQAAEAEHPGQDLALLHPSYGACLATADSGAGVPWRFSDGHAVTMPTGMMSECGCFARVGGQDIVDPSAIAGVVIPTSHGGELPRLEYPSPILPRDNDDPDRGGYLRGFPIGTWSGEMDLPQGCEYVPVDDENPVFDTRILVRCDITASELAGGRAGQLTVAQTDVKEHCRQRDRLGFNIVVHVPLPAEAIVCEPPEDAPHYCYESGRYGERDAIRPAPWSTDPSTRMISSTVQVTETDLDMRGVNGGSCTVAHQPLGATESRSGEGIRSRRDD